jgi:hypothetical protein
MRARRADIALIARATGALIGAIELRGALRRRGRFRQLR